MNRRDTERDQDYTILRVTNWSQSKASGDQDGGANALVQFLEKKASPPRGPALQIYHSEVRGSVMSITVKTASVDRFLHLDGFTWAGIVLKVQSNEPMNRSNNSLESRVSRPGQPRESAANHAPAGPRNNTWTRGGNQQQQAPQQRQPSRRTMSVDEPTYSQSESQKPSHSQKMSMDERCPAVLLPENEPHFDDTSGIAVSFINQFFVLYDTNRTEAIQNYYDDASTFSLSVSSTPPRQRDRTDPQENPSHLTAYIPLSRNLIKVTRPPTRASRKFTGQSAIYDAWTQIPKSEHLSLTDPTAYTVEVTPIPAIPSFPPSQIPQGVTGLHITISSLFQDEDKQTGNKEIKSFFRTFILGPGAGPGGIRVLSDALVVRAPKARELMILRFKGDSKLKWKHAREALVQNDWDYEKAGALFVQMNGAGQIPPDAFAV